MRYFAFFKNPGGRTGFTLRFHAREARTPLLAVPIKNEIPVRVDMTWHSQ